MGKYLLIAVLLAACATEEVEIMPDRVRSIRQGAPSGARVSNIRRGEAPSINQRSIRTTGPEGRDVSGTPSSLSGQLRSAQGELQTKLDARLQQEIKLLTTRYSGDTALAERVARGRMGRNFAASDPDFAGEIAPIQARISDLEEQIRKATQRRAVGTIGGSGETLG